MCKTTLTTSPTSHTPEPPPSRKSHCPPAPLSRMMSSSSPCSPVTSAPPSVSPLYPTSVMALGAAPPRLPLPTFIVSAPAQGLSSLSPASSLASRALVLPSVHPRCPVDSFSACADPLPPLLKALLWLPLPFIYSPNCIPAPSGSLDDQSRPLRPLPTLHLNFWSGRSLDH